MWTLTSGTKKVIDVLSFWQTSFFFLVNAFLFFPIFDEKYCYIPRCLISLQANEVFLPFISQEWVKLGLIGGE